MFSQLGVANYKIVQTPLNATIQDDYLTIATDGLEVEKSYVVVVRAYKVNYPEIEAIQFAFRLNVIELPKNERDY